MATPLMGLTLPTAGAGGTAGPTFATLVNAALTLIDSHDHSSGKGTKIGVGGFTIDGDLDFSPSGTDYDAVGLRSVRLADQGTTLSAGSDLLCLYANGDDLYYIDGSGNNVRLTASGGINAASIGSIGGDYGTGTEAVSYSNTTKVYSFTQSTGVWGKIASADLILYEAAAVTNSITIKSPTSLAASYSLTLLAALPADDLTSNLLGITSAGVISAIASPVMTTPQINDTSADHQYIFGVSELLADRTITLPLLTGNDTFVFVAHTQTLTNKTLTSPTINAGALSGTFTGTPTFSGAVVLSGSPVLTTPDINGGTADSLTSLSIRNSAAAYDVTLAATDASQDAGRTLTLDLNNAARSIDMGGNLTLAGALTTSGAYALTLTLTGTTGVTLPESGTLATLAGAETLTNKTLTSPVLNGWTGTGPAASAWPSFYAYKASSESDQTVSAVVKITFAAEDYDTNNDYASSTFTPTVAGKYLLVAHITYGGHTSGTRKWLQILKNGATQMASMEKTVGSETFGQMTITAIVDADGAADYFEVHAGFSSGASFEIYAANTRYTFFTGCRIG